MYFLLKLIDILVFLTLCIAHGIFFGYTEAHLLIGFCQYYVARTILEI